jgi:outer membrane protein assembly factor BamB
LACRPEAASSPAGWELLLGQLGSSSSPRAVDLNGDDIKDIVIGAGRREYQATDSALIAINGKTGSVLWTAPADDQLFASPLFVDINRNGTADVIIGGRSAQLLAVEGNTGRTIWKDQPDGGDQLYNFYNPQLVEDINNDQIPDLLIANGGNPAAAPGNRDRPAGRLMLIDSRTGQLIAQAVVPDGKETYMSCLSYSWEDTTYVIYGTGGETIPGKLYRTDLNAILQADLSNSLVLAESRTKGFIAPPVLADISRDGIPDIIANAADGRTLAIDGSTLEPLWTVQLPNTEVYCSLAVGQFDADGIPDFFTNYGIGQFPDLMSSVQITISGSDGALIRQDTLGSFHYSSPVAMDTNGDGLDEVYYHLNERLPGVVKNSLVVWDFSSPGYRKIYETANGANLGSTPLLTDLDQDGQIEIVIAHENNPFDIFSIEAKYGLWVKMIPTGIRPAAAVRWGTYMGSRSDGIY